MSKWTFLFSSILLLFCSLCSPKLSADQSDLPEPYRSVRLLPFDPQGWYFNGEQIQSLFINNKINTVNEVGSWLGLSTRHMASLLSPNVKVFAVDHWKGSAEHQGFENLNRIYEQFLSNVIHKHLTDKIIPVRMSSLEAARLFKSATIQADLIYIDASHDTPSVLDDLNAWFPFVQGHGILCGDDWGYPPVKHAVEIFAQENRLIIEASGNFWMLRE